MQNAILAFKMPLSEAGIAAVLGYAVVFVGLIMLMIVVSLIGKIFVMQGKKNKAAAPEEASPVQEAPKATAPGTAGELKLYNVDPKTAAMLMAIVADKLQKPINELRFISIKEVE